MSPIFKKIPFLLELFFSGIFLLLYSLESIDKIPRSWNGDIIDNILQAGVFIIPWIILLRIIVDYIQEGGAEKFLRKHAFSFIVFVSLLIVWGDIEFSFVLASVHLFSSVLALYEQDQTVKSSFLKDSLIKKIKLRPARLVLLSFSLVIFLGTFLLMLPVSTVEGKAISFIDAFFMATSATCVTGLSTLSLADHFSFFGQLVILGLIQIGGLSIMTLYSSTIILLGQSMGMKDRIIMQDLLAVSSLEELFVMIMDIVKYTFFIELWGGVILTMAFSFEGFEFGSAIYYGFFHSISAFCNAGFSLFNNSLESYATNPLIHGTISCLVILGGLGFIVLRDIKEIIIKRKSLVRMALHSKIVLVTSAALIGMGMLFLFFGEFLNSLDNYSLWEKIQVAFFQSVTLRTAGFHTIGLDNLHTYTIYAMSLFMFIGGSPGSTAGGIKVTTFAILIQSIISTLKGRKSVGMVDRRIPPHMVVKATALTFISIMITSFFILVMMRIESEQSFLTVFFEVVSASGTVGLSLGITPYLSVPGKIAIALMMLIGRIGPLTLVLAIGERMERTGKFDYPEGRIMIG
ncbi:MAG: TrkH family potassium uptake protein [Halobacteriovoraceae bacterium]|nr:TrkH family potassium uptake protein [Halobacteriovoraceae bacterium]